MRVIARVLAVALAGRPRAIEGALRKELMIGLPPIVKVSATDALISYNRIPLPSDHAL